MWRSARRAWRCLPALILVAGLSAACAPDGPLALDDDPTEPGAEKIGNGGDDDGDTGDTGGDDPGGDQDDADDDGDDDADDGDGDAPRVVPSIVRQGLAGTNLNHDSATSVALSYNHPGGILIVFVRHNGTEIGGISGRFDGRSLPLRASVEAGRRDFERSGYLFVADLPAGNDAIVIDLDGVRRDQRGIVALSVAETDGVRVTATHGARNPGAHSAVGLSVGSEEDDLVLGYVAWRFSDADVASQSSGQSTVVDDDRPTRQQAHAKVGRAGGTSLGVTFDDDPSSTVYLAVSLKPVGGP